jgi:CspA family cold shock protein
MMTDKIYTGVVCWFNAKRGIGFITWEKDGSPQRDMFLHYSDIKCEGFKTLYKDQRVEFLIGTNVHGQPKAIEVTVVK